GLYQFSGHTVQPSAQSKGETRKNSARCEQTRSMVDRVDWGDGSGLDGFERADRIFLGIGLDWCRSSVPPRPGDLTSVWQMGIVLVNRLSGPYRWVIHRPIFFPIFLATWTS